MTSGNRLPEAMGPRIGRGPHPLVRATSRWTVLAVISPGRMCAPIPGMAWEWFVIEWAAKGSVWDIPF